MARATHIENELRALGRRSPQRHPVSDLPTREPLLLLMAEDGSGTLGIIALEDFDRLCALDPEKADDMLKTLALRLLRMTGGRRMVAQVDRARLAIWLGPDVAVCDAHGQLEAISYALHAPLDEEMSFAGQLTVHHATFDHAVETPQNALARLLAVVNSRPGRGGMVHRVNDAAVSNDREQFALEQDLRHALTRGELELCYQPQIDARKGRVAGAEALLRWRSPVHGMVSPMRFIPLLEQLGLIEEVGLWVLNAACRMARQWQALELGSLSVAVNVAPQQLEDATFHARVRRTLEAQGLAPQALEIELTESQAVADPNRAERQFTPLRALGVKIAIDDFGTGFSSFSALRKLDFDKIKIDREFVTDVEQRRDSQAICQSMIALARGLGIRVIAEGVERAEEYRWLLHHGCHEFQGFYFSRPLAGPDFADFLRNSAGLTAKLAVDPRQSQQKILQRFGS
ncbi:putative bifunctional diguanylate cyclase/phosphodiesterase [Novosphingobium terrae]|uniref:putative bifunctional diguanylate cyclase/phosphodiesterase n=1 Tax=Novosphingobium terrae TaxID=2726189 RepID=UPI00197CC8D0|nr:EAL domain-containing protein [Novosphingobium terrae]